MDIQVASNFERFIWFAVGRDPAKVRTVMETFRRTGAYRFENFDRDTFSASRASDTEIAGLIARVYREHGYVCDPHTACGFKDLAPDRVNVVLATASPAKFPDTIRAAIGVAPTHPSLEALKSVPVVKHRIVATPDAIRAFIDARAV
jgi:threonine synthase